ncbi:MAG: YdjY domain-containing protein [Thermoguttaceae bacterium]
MMRTSPIAGKVVALLGAGVIAIAATALSGCPGSTPPKEKPSTAPPQKQAPAAKPQPAPSNVQAPSGTLRKVADEKPQETPQEELNQDLQKIADSPRDLGEPLVEDADLHRLSTEQPVWVDAKNKQVVLLGEVCKAGYPLEFFATYSNRAYESVVAVNVKSSIIHTGLLAVGAKPGHPAHFQPEFSPPTGTEIAIEVRWKDRQGKVQRARAQDWVRDVKTKKALELNWVFAGSIAEKDADGQFTSYQADGGDMICVLSLPSAMLDLPRHGYGAIEARSFEAFAERLPPEGTPVTLLLKPVLTGKSAKKAAKKISDADRAAYEKKAIEAAEAWLALIDKGEYSKGWESAASYYRNAVERHEMIQKFNAMRKPLGKVKSRTISAKQYTTSPPGAPDGHYVILQFKTVFEKKADAVETVTPMLDKDKKWRVSGYYVR